MTLQLQELTSRVVAYVKGTEYDNQGRAIELSDENAPVLRDLGNGLAISYVVDEGSQFKYIQRRDLNDGGLSPEQLRELAISNLESVVANRVRVAPHGDVFAVFVDGNYEASLILLDSYWDTSFRSFVRGQYAIAVPTRDVLAFCNSGSKEGVSTLREIIRRLNESGADHPVSNHLYVRDGKDWRILS